jgi:hypothetical protein
MSPLYRFVFAFYFVWTISLIMKPETRLPLFECALIRDIVLPLNEHVDSIHYEVWGAHIFPTTLCRFDLVVE